MTDKFKKLFNILAIGTGLIVLLSLIFFTLFRIFERITYDSISDLNKDFAIQIDSLTESINSTIVNYGMQLFYSDPVKKMMGTTQFSNTDRVYMTRDLNTSLSSTDFAESIAIHNGFTGRVYSTDPAYPNQLLEQLNKEQIRSLLLNRTNEQRFKPIYCKESAPSNKEYYTFMFYELNSDGTPKPSTLIITVKSGWYKKSLLAANPSSDLIVIDKTGSVLVSANESLKTEYLEYYPLITKEKDSGYIVNHKKNQICMYYESMITGHTYMKISSLSKMLPRLMYFRKLVVYLLVSIISMFCIVLSILLIFALLPMLKLKAAIKMIDKLQTGDGPAPESPPIPLNEQINAVVSRSERANLEGLFYDMLASKLTPDASKLFKVIHGHFGLMLVHAKHRKDIYESTERQHPEMIVAKSSHIYACLGLYEDELQFTASAEQINLDLNCRCYLSLLFDDFSTLPEHFNNLNELRKLSLTLPSGCFIVHEEELFEKATTNTITTRDFTDLIVKLKSGSIEAGRTKLGEILGTIEHYRYDDFQYILYRTEDTICVLLNEFSSDLVKEGKKLLPESLEQIKSMDEIRTAFDRAIGAISENHSEKKAEKYSELAKQIRGLVESHYHDGSLNSQNIADMINMNNAYLGRMFKSAYGCSINDYINTCRIEESKVLLRQSDEPVEEIARKVGFANIKYFYVLFKKAVGVTPAKYRGGDM